MPIYEYRCLKCGEKFEKLVRLSTSTSEIECPKCGGQDVEHHSGLHQRVWPLYLKAVSRR
ncbi:MAG: zinc ribbon domain-containing protein [Anaerolineae bacterium]|nr:zinc ribbon domain-containing protein [Anaerolineae bacterium]